MELLSAQFSMSKCIKYKGHMESGKMGEGLTLPAGLESVGGGGGAGEYHCKMEGIFWLISQLLIYKLASLCMSGSAASEDMGGWAGRYVS